MMTTCFVCLRSGKREGKGEQRLWSHGKRCPGKHKHEERWGGEWKNNEKGNHMLLLLYAITGLKSSFLPCCLEPHPCIVFVCFTTYGDSLLCMDGLFVSAPWPRRSICGQYNFMLTTEMQHIWCGLSLLIANISNSPPAWYNLNYRVFIITIILVVLPKRQCLLSSESFNIIIFPNCALIKFLTSIWKVTLGILKFSQTTWNFSL